MLIKKYEVVDHSIALHECIIFSVFPFKSARGKDKERGTAKTTDSREKCGRTEEERKRGWFSESALLLVTAVWTKEEVVWK